MGAGSSLPFLSYALPFLGPFSLAEPLNTILRAFCFHFWPFLPICRHNPPLALNQDLFGKAVQAQHSLQVWCKKRWQTLRCRPCSGGVHDVTGQHQARARTVLQTLPFCNAAITCDASPLCAHALPYVITSHTYDRRSLHTLILALA